MLEFDEVLDSELVRAREMVVEIDQPGAERPIRLLATPIKLSRTPADPAGLPAPALGEHTDELLARRGSVEQGSRPLHEDGAVAGTGQTVRGSFMG